MDEPTFSVGELNLAISEALVDAFPRQVWVRGEIQQFHASRNQHVYFELVEKDGNRDRVRAALRVALFRNDRPAVNRALKEVPGVKLTDGVEVRIRGRVDFYPPTGRLQLVMNGIDPVFTVGRLAADRERVLRVLAAEDLLRRNATHELVHCVTLYANPRIANNPRWLWESVALWENGELVDPRTLDYMVAGRPPTLEQLSADVTASRQVYEVGYTIGEFVVARGGPEALVRLVQANGDTAVALGLPTPAFEEAWYSFVRTRYLQ